MTNLNWRIPGAAIAALGILIVTSGCTGQEAATRSEAPIAERAVCAALTPVVEGQLDSRISGKTAGFGDITDLSGQPSAYTTAWSLALANEIGAPISTTLRTHLRAFFRDLISTPVASGLSLSDAQILGLSAHSERILGGDKRGVADAASTLLDGSEYRGDVHGEPTDAATALVMQALADAEQPIPAAVIEHARQQVHLLPASASLADITNNEIPRLTMVALAADQSSAISQSPTLSASVRSYFDVVRSGSIDGVVLGDLVALERDARILKISLPTLDKNLSAALLVQGTGYLSITPGGNGDPQTTASAAYLGLLPDPAAAKATLLKGLGPNGWVSELTPSVHSTLIASLALGRCGVELPAIQPVIALAIRQVSLDSTSPADAADLDKLASVYGVAVPASIRAQLTAIGQSTAKRGIADGNPIVVWRAASLLDGTIAAQLPITWKPKLPSAASAVSAIALGRLLHRDDLVVAGTKKLSSLKLHNAWKWNQSATEVDAYSTALASTTSDWPTAQREHLLTTFKRGGLWGNLPAKSPDTHTTLASLYAAVVISSPGLPAEDALHLWPGE